MRTMRMLLLAAVAAPAWACQASSSSGADLAMEEQNVRARSVESMRAFQANDHSAFSAMFAMDGEILEPNGPAHQGTAAIVAFSERMGELPNVEVRWEPTQITVANAGDLAVERGTYEMSFDGPDGRIADNGKYITVWVKRDGRWMSKHEMFNSSVPLPSM